MTRDIHAWHDNPRYACDICSKSYSTTIEATHCEFNHKELGEMYPSAPPKPTVEQRLAALEAKVDALLEHPAMLVPPLFIES